MWPRRVIQRSTVILVVNAMGVLGGGDLDRLLPSVNGARDRPRELHIDDDAAVEASGAPAVDGRARRMAPVSYQFG